MSSEKNTPKNLHEQLQESQLKINELMLHGMQLTRLIWLLTKQSGGRVTLSPENISMLWSLKKEAGPNPGELVLIADTLTELKEEQIQRLAQLLVGTKTYLRQVMEEFELHYYPLPYVQLRLSPYVVFHQGWWIAPENVKQAQAGPN